MRRGIRTSVRVLAMLCVSSVWLGTAARAQGGYQPLRLVTVPTAGTLPWNTYVLETHLFDGGGFSQRVMVSLTDYLLLGVSYGGANLIGSRRVDWQPHAGAEVRVRIIEESLTAPGVVIGFDSQGEGPYLPELGRFRTKSRGAYLAISRNYLLLGNLGIHGGANYSFEDSGDRDPSFWVGVDKSVGGLMELCGEYDFATNDNEDNSITADRGWLNAAIRFRIGGAFIIQFDVENILRNAKRDFTGTTQDRPEPSRELRLVYRSRF